MKQHAGKGATAKHAGTSKHGGRGAKHNPARQPKWTPAQQRQFAHWVAKHPQQAKPRQLSPGEVACCSAEALGASLRLAGWPVPPESVLALHAAAGGSRDAGVTIQAALEAARRYGLAGVRPEGFGTALGEDGWFVSRPGQILGLELPGPHAVTVAPDGCWLSWGEHYGPAEWPDAVIEEAWQVTWPAAGARHVSVVPCKEESYQ